MHIVVIGSSANYKECRAKFGDDICYLRKDPGDTTELSLTSSDVVFDFLSAYKPLPASLYKTEPGAIFLDASCSALSQLRSDGYEIIKCPTFGFAGMPSFLNRRILEVSLSLASELTALTEWCNILKTEFQIVADQVGLVTPRVICMIINEAWFAFGEGTARKADIDLAMKMGTNYPYGPFEWCTKIGSRNVIRLLEAMRRTTADERYNVCPLLLKDAM